MEIKKIHLETWCEVCRPLDQGRLGVRFLNSMIKALLDIWLCRLGNEHLNLQRQVTKVKFGAIDQDWNPNLVVVNYGTDLWKGITQIYDWMYGSSCGIHPCYAT